MLKKMQQRFIIAAMVSVALVMTFIIAGINTASFFRIQKSQDKKLRGIYEYDQMASENHSLIAPPISEMPWAGEPDAEFTVRFFIVHCDKHGNLKVFGNEYISSVDEEEAEQFTKEVLDKHRSAGYHGDYRFLVEEDGEDLAVIFLNVSDDKSYSRSLAMVSLTVGLISMLLILALIVLLSRAAVRPYARNMERQKQFITDAGHELRTPITSIITSADIAAMKYEDDEWIRNIREQAERLTDLTNDLVALSRLDEEAPLLETAEFMLSDVVRETAEMFRPRAKAEGKTYNVDIKDGISYRGDREQIRKMLSILLDNAFKYSTAGGIVRLAAYRERDKVCMEVFNTCSLGEDIDLERLFDRFYRPDRSRSSKTGGSGLGLSIAQMTAQAHGGRIDVRSDDRESIIFKVIL